MKDTYFVTISDRKMIPGIGKGPIKKPIHITKKKFELLKTLGFHIEIASNTIVLNKKENIVEPTSDKEVITTEVESKEIVDESLEGDASDELDYSEEDIIDDEDKEIVDESLEGDASDELDYSEEEENDEDIIDESEVEEIYDIETLTKEQLKDKLKELGVNFPNNAGINKLRDILSKNMD